MTAIARPAAADLARAASIAGAVATACTVAIATGARAADVTLEVDGARIPVAAFAWWTVVGTVLGAVLATLLRERWRFVAVAVSLTALSLIPAIVAPDDGATRLVLVAAHVIAAAVVVPVLGARLTTTRP